MGKDLTPESQGKVFIFPTKYRYKVVFEDLGCFLGNIPSMVMGLHELLFHAILFITYLNSSYHSLSNRYNFGCMPFSFNQSINLWYDLIILPAVMFFIGLHKILLLSSSNSTIRYFFPWNNFTGNLTVWSEYICDLTRCASYTILHILPFPFCLFIDTSLPISVASNVFVDISQNLILCPCPFHIYSDYGDYSATVITYSLGQDA